MGIDTLLISSDDPSSTMSAPLLKKQKTQSGPKDTKKYIVDFSAPANDSVFDGDAYAQYMKEHIKVDGKAGNLGDKISVTKEGDGKWLPRPRPCVTRISSPSSRHDAPWHLGLGASSLRRHPLRRAFNGGAILFSATHSPVPAPSATRAEVMSWNGPHDSEKTFDEAPHPSLRPSMPSRLASRHWAVSSSVIGLNAILAEGSVRPLSPTARILNSLTRRRLRHSTRILSRPSHAHQPRPSHASSASTARTSAASKARIIGVIARISAHLARTPGVLSTHPRRPQHASRAFQYASPEGPVRSTARIGASPAHRPSPSMPETHRGRHQGGTAAYASSLKACIH